MSNYSFNSLGNRGDTALETPPINCPICGTTFTPPNRKNYLRNVSNGYNTTCSAVCRKISGLRGRTAKYCKPCAACSRPTTNPKYCNRSCAAKATNNTHPKRKPIERRCKLCKTTFFCGHKNESKQFCVACVSIHRTVRAASSEYYRNCTVADYTQKLALKGKHPSWKSAHIRSLNRRWNANLRRIGCQVCGYCAHIEFAHIKPVTAFPGDAKLVDVNSPDNNLILCRNHHWEFDHHVLTLGDIPPRPEQEFRV